MKDFLALIAFTVITVSAGFIIGFAIGSPKKIGHATCINGEMWADWGEHGGHIISYKDDRILVNMKRQCKKIGE